MQVGKPNYSQRGGSGDRLTFHKLGMADTQRSLIVRIAPPVKSMAETGRFATYIKQHFGYKLKVGDKSIPRTFLCLEKKDRNKNVIEECPECEENALKKASLEAKIQTHKLNGLSDEEIKNAVAPLSMYLKDHNLDKKWHLLAKNQAGQWGFLTLSHKAYENFLTCIKNVQTQMGIDDPLGVENGCWFSFTRTGFKFNEITDTCTVLQEAVGRGQTQIKLDTMTEKDFAAIEALPDLTNWGVKLTYDQVKLLVSSGGADDVVKSIFDSGRKNSPPAQTEEVRTAPAPREVRVEQPNSGLAGPSAPVAAQTAPAPTPEPVDEMAQLRAQLAALQVKLGNKPQEAIGPAAKQTQNTLPPAITKKLDLNVDDFLAEIDS